MSNLRRNVVTTLLALVAAVVVLLGAGRGDTVSDLRMTVGRFEQDVLLWEVTNFLDKWVHLALRPIRGAPSPEERVERLVEFYQLGAQSRSLRASLERSLALSPEARSVEPSTVQAELDAVESRRAELQAEVEETLESLISSVLEEMGIIDRFGPVRWPPVDFTFTPNSLVLVRSPRDRIQRLDDVLLRPAVSLLEQVAIEQAIEEDGETTALVIRVGGVATYPAQVSPDTGLHDALILAAHEWMHHWLFFRPLGRAWWAGGELTSINETVADIVGEEVGDRAYELLTGRPVEREPWQPPTVRPPREPEPGVFDYAYEMRQTRLRLDELLAAGLVEEAEAYLEARRQEFVANGFNIRKLNTAWFAFHGTYASSPGSVSPIEAQLRTLRAGSADLASFLDRVSGISQRGQLEEMARAAGWAPVEADGGDA